MSEVYNWSVRELVERASSAAPTPGGGSIAALAGSLGTAMVAMVGNLTVGKAKYADIEPQVQTELTRLTNLLNKLEGLVAEDMQAFGNFMAVLKLSKDTVEQQQIRTTKMQQTLKEATETPLAIARACLEALEIAERLAGIGNQAAISDIGVGAFLAEAALQSAMLSVDINLPGIKDAGYVEQVRTEKAFLIEQSKALKEQCINQVRQRI